MTNGPLERKVLNVFGREQAFWTGIIALTFFHIALLMLAVSPVFIPDFFARMNVIDTSVVVLCVVSLSMMYLHAFGIMVRFTRWAYLVGVFVTALVLSVFRLGDPINFSVSDEITMILFMLTGGFVAASMHIEHGGRHYTAKSKVV